MIIYEIGDIIHRIVSDEDISEKYLRKLLYYSNFLIEFSGLKLNHAASERILLMKGKYKKMVK